MYGNELTGFNSPFIWFCRSKKIWRRNDIGWIPKFWKFGLLWPAKAIFPDLSSLSTSVYRNPIKEASALFAYALIDIPVPNGCNQGNTAKLKGNRRSFSDWGNYRVLDDWNQAVAGWFEAGIHPQAPYLAKDEYSLIRCSRPLADG